jgi:hypothetical protein
LGIVAIATAASAIGVVIGSIMGIKLDFQSFAPVIAGIMTFSAVMAQMGGLILKETTEWFCTAKDVMVFGTPTCGETTVIIALTIGTMGFLFFWSVVEWWRNPAAN